MQIRTSMRGRKTGSLRSYPDYGKTSRMENIRQEVGKFISSCERLFGFTHESGRLTPEECQVLEYYAQELQRQIAPLCIDPTAPCQDNPVSSPQH